MRILLVEDEKKVAAFIKKGLMEEFYTVDVAVEGEDGLFMATNAEYDLIILDVMLPDMNGIDICREIRKQNIKTPVMMLTAVDATESKVEGLDSGADDYVTKPFSFDEFLARVRSLLRRPSSSESSLKVKDLTLDPVKHEVYRAGKKVDLTWKEFALLEYMIRNKGRVLSRTRIFENIWGYDVETSSNIVDVYVSYLRDKVDKHVSPKLIHTVRGVGYILRED
ncbi:MAG: response regulator transcription factor [Nitrospiraceae bacterium]|jgi:heavy metal response regulator|nr:MAG: response regulator transcription factor [Nitrospiraceae bacterium]UCH45411.1 MAG: response regulator transcription factor [Nitrospiraceae bacterium]